MTLIGRRMVLAVLAGLLLAGASETGAPAGSSDWVTGHNARARLISGPLLGTGERIVGVQIETAPGWHTYWRNPGDSGVPPSFDWSGSDNLAEARVEWPAPRSLPLEYGTSIGYEDEVVFPVVLRPGDAAAPIDIALRLDYAACLDICVPLSAEITARFAPADPPETTQIGLVNRYHALVPREQGPGADAGPRVTRAWAEEKGGTVVLNVEAKAEQPAELFVEGPSPFYFTVPAGAAESPDGNLVFAIEVDGANEPGDLLGAALTATLVSANGAVEHSWTVE